MSSGVAAVPSSLPPVGFRPIHENYPRGSFDLSAGELPPYYKDDARCYEAAQQYLASIVPDIEVEPLSNKGTTGIVMHDKTHAYKVFRSPCRDYTSIENETAALWVMGHEGVAPPLVALLDAADDKRFASWTGRHTKSLFDRTVPIPYMRGSGHLPVIVTKLRELVPIAELPGDLLVPEFRRIAAAMIKHNLLCVDGEFMYDPVNRQAVAVDWGEACHTRTAEESPPDYPPAYNALINEATLVYDAFVRFCPPYAKMPAITDIADKLAAGGIANLDAPLRELCQK